MFYQDLLSLLGMEVKSEDRPQKVVCYKTGDKTRGLDLEELGKRLKSGATLIPWLAGRLPFLKEKKMVTHLKLMTAFLKVLL